MLDLSKIPDKFLHDVEEWTKENLPDPEARDISRISPKEFFTRWLEWNGIQGFANYIWQLRDYLDNANLHPVFYRFDATDGEKIKKDLSVFPQIVVTLDLHGQGGGDTEVTVEVPTGSSHSDFVEAYLACQQYDLEEDVQVLTEEDCR